jgi:hypothetical protein
LRYTRESEYPKQKDKCVCDWRLDREVAPSPCDFWMPAFICDIRPQAGCRFVAGNDRAGVLRAMTKRLFAARNEGKIA